MAKKEITFRPMFGFSAPSALALQAGEKLPKAVVDEVSKTPLMQKLKREADKDATIAELRASLKALEAKEVKRRKAAREGMKKLRAKRGSKAKT